MSNATRTDPATAPSASAAPLGYLPARDGLRGACLLGVRPDDPPDDVHFSMQGADEVARDWLGAEVVRAARERRLDGPRPQATKAPDDAAARRREEAATRSAPAARDPLAQNASADSDGAAMADSWSRRATAMEHPAMPGHDDHEVLFLPCPAGVEELLAAEMHQIAGPEVELYVRRGGVTALAARRAAVGLVLRFNLESRLAQRVLWCVAEDGYRDEDDVYALARRVRWGDWITPRQTLRVDVTAQRSPLRSLKFAALRVKDGVCDQMRAGAGARPSVDTRRPDLPLVLHLGEQQLALYVDTSGEALFKRGWRDDAGEAPLKETLAAAMLAAAGWRGGAADGPLLDPCCGAGTIAIEAAQIACGIAPGAQRRFAFERLGPFRDAAPEWQRLRAAAAARVHAPAVPVFAGDVSFRMTDFATRNAERAGVRHAIDFKTADVLQRPAPAPSGTLMLNPPYGERIGAKGAHARARTTTRDGTPLEFFVELAAHWKRAFGGWTAWILSPDMRLPSMMRLKESRRVPLWNGPIECRLFRFDMVAGSARATRAAEDAGDARRS